MKMKTRGGFGMGFFRDSQSPSRGLGMEIFHFGLDQRISKNPQWKMANKSPIPGLKNSQTFISQDLNRISDQKAISDEDLLEHILKNVRS